MAIDIDEVQLIKLCKKKTDRENPGLFLGVSLLFGNFFAYCKLYIVAIFVVQNRGIRFTVYIGYFQICRIVRVVRRDFIGVNDFFANVDIA